jgi:hypothetical protein
MAAISLVLQPAGVAFLALQAPGQQGWPFATILARSLEVNLGLLNISPLSTRVDTYSMSASNTRHYHGLLAYS